MKYSRLELFLHNKEAQDKYSQGVRLLQEAGVFEVLNELAFTDTLPVTLPNRMEVASAEHFKTAGYRQCVSDLLTLNDMRTTEQQPLFADFGAIERMLARGEITDEEAKALRRAATNE